jgi:hypothetical protein
VSTLSYKAKQLFISCLAFSVSHSLLIISIAYNDSISTVNLNKTVSTAAGALSNLKKLTFASGSQIKTLGDGCFAECGFDSLALPDQIESNPYFSATHGMLCDKSKTT